MSFLTKWLTLGLVGAFVVVVTVFAAIVRFTDYMRAHPWRFVMEILMLSIVSSVPIMFIGALRQTQDKKFMIEFAILAAKIGVAYVLTELAGVNNYLFR